MSYFDEIVKQFGFNSYREYQLIQKNIDHNVIGKWQYQFCELLNFVFDLKYKRVLDIGCACGSILKVLKDKYHCDVYGIEIDSEFIRQSKYKNEVNIINDEACNLSKHFNNNFFNFIFSVQVFEHFRDLEYSKKVVKACYDILKNESLMYVSAVFGEHLTIEQIKQIYEKNPDAIDITHINIHPYETWKDIFESYGFIDVTGIVQPVFDLYYFNDDKWSFYKEYKWHQIIVYKGYKINKLFIDMKKKLEYILINIQPPKNIVYDYLQNRICNEYFKKILCNYLK